MAIYQSNEPFPYGAQWVDPKTGNLTIEAQRYLQRLFQNADTTQGEVGTKADAGAVGDSGLTMVSDRLLGRDDAGIGPIEELTLSQALDLIGSAAQGDILYRGAANWARLPAGTAGFFLRTNGAGADPEWAAGGSGGYGYEAAPTVPTTAGFTLQNAGTASMSDAANGRGIILTTPNVAAPGQTRFVRKNGAPPAAPYSIITRHSWVTSGSSAQIYKSCIILRNSTSGRIIIFGDYNSGQILAQRWSSYSGFNADIIAPANQWAMVSMPWRRVRNNGTTLFFALSEDGENWHEYGTSEALATYINAAGGTVDEIGFGSMSNNPGFTNITLFNSFTAA